MRTTTCALVLALTLAFGCSGGDATHEQRPQPPAESTPSAKLAAQAGTDPAGTDATPAASATPPETAAPAETPPAAPLTGKAALAALRANVSETAARPEHTDPLVEVSHILIAFKDAARSSATRSKDEAEQLAAELLARARAGEDFEQLRQEFTDDRQAGKAGEAIYRMSLEPKQRYYQRGRMVAAFGNVGWRLAPDEIGVAAHEPQDSPFGWHIIKRVK